MALGFDQLVFDFNGDSSVTQADAQALYAKWSNTN